MYNMTKIATILNTVIVPNALGAETTIAEDLSNISTLGTAFASFTIDQLKSYMGDLFTGIYYDFIGSKEFKEETYGSYINAREFGGVMARVRAKLIKAVDTPIAQLESYWDDPSNAPDYNDGKYYGPAWDNELWSKDVSFAIPFSVSVEQFRKAFTNAEDTMQIMALFEEAAQNSVKHKLNELARANMRKLILASYTDGRRVKLITTYNTMHGYQQGDAGFIDLTNWNLSPEFKLFCQETVIELKKYMQDINAKYNDGAIDNFTSPEDIRSTLLTQFSVALDFNQSAVFHQELTSIGEHYTINFWQNQTKELLPVISSTSQFDCIKEDNGVSQDPTVISHIVGVIYSKYSLGITSKLDKITSEYISKGDFVQNWHHVIKRYFVDGREGALVLTLE